MAYDFLIALIKNVEGILLEPDHQMVPVIRNRNGDKHQIHINLERVPLLSGGRTSVDGECWTTRGATWTFP